MGMNAPVLCLLLLSTDSKVKYRRHRIHQAKRTDSCHHSRSVHLPIHPHQSELELASSRRHDGVILLAQTWAVENLSRKPMSRNKYLQGPLETALPPLPSLYSENSKCQGRRA